MNSNEKRLYNSILSKMYILYLEKHYPEVNVHDILKDASLDEASINDPSHWFTQKEVNRFHNAIVKYSGGENIPYCTGKFGFEESMKDSEETIKKRAQALGNPIEVFNELLPLAGVLTKSCSYQTYIESDSTIKVIVTENSNITEEPFQCESRKGYFTGLVKMFDDYLRPGIEHDKCMFNGKQKKGNRVCEYVITLKRKYTSEKTKAEEIERLRDELSKTRKELSRAYTDLLKMEKENYTLTILMDEMGSVFQEKITMNDIIGKTLRTLGKRLDFNLGIVFLADHDESNLLYRGHFGSDDADDIKFLKDEAIFPLKDKKLGPFATCFSTKDIRVVPNTGEIIGEIIEAEKKIIDRFKIKSFICTPIIHKGACLGVFAVSNKENDKHFSRKDEIFVSGIASDLGVIIHNYLKYLEETYSKIKDRESEKQKTIREDLASRAIHNIRTPTTIIQNWLDILDRNNKFPTETNQALDNIRVSNSQIQELVLDFKRYLKPFSKRVKSTDVEKLIDSISKKINPTISIKKSFISKKGISELQIDPIGFSWLFEELIENSRKNKAKSVKLSLQKIDRKVIFTIEDDGEGISNQISNKIFEPFFSTDSMGTGIGLTSAKKIIDEHGGKIYFDPHFENGAKCVIELPL